jgi:ATP-binding cassette, subfamily B, bacterial
MKLPPVMSLLDPDLRWLFAFLRPQRESIIVVLLLSLLAGSAGLLQPYLTKLIIDEALIAGDVQALGIYCLSMVLASAVYSLLSGVNSQLHTRLSGQILLKIRSRLYQHLMTLSPNFYAKTPIGDLLSRLNGDVAEIQRFAVDALLAAVNGLLMLSGSLAILMWLNAELALLAFLLLPAQVLFLKHRRPKVQQATLRVREHNATLSDFLVTRLSRVKTIQSNNAAEREAQTLDHLSTDHLDDQLRLQWINFITAAVPGLLLVVNTALVFYLGGLSMNQGDMSIGGLIAFSLYLAKATGPAQTLLGSYSASHRARVSLSRVLALLQHQADVVEVSTPQQLPVDGPGQLRLQAVTFAYPNVAEYTLKAVSADIPAGAKVGIWGASGAGKSTLQSLLQRHYDPQQGAIYLDGVNLSQAALASVRARVAAVDQDCLLIAGSLMDNIRYGNPAATDQEVYDAAKLACIDDCIRAMPKGYHTDIGERGAQLSGGQRQRLCIARAVLQKPSVLLLDEATSAIDLPTALAILDTVDRLFANTTRIIISHQQALLDQVDQCYELAQGKLWPVSQP